MPGVSALLPCCHSQVFRTAMTATASKPLREGGEESPGGHTSPEGQERSFSAAVRQPGLWMSGLQAAPCVPARLSVSGGHAGGQTLPEQLRCEAHRTLQSWRPCVQAKLIPGQHQIPNLIPKPPGLGTDTAR